MIICLAVVVLLVTPMLVGSSPASYDFRRQMRDSPLQKHLSYRVRSLPLPVSLQVVHRYTTIVAIAVRLVLGFWSSPRFTTIYLCVQTQ
jgi:hypothetical protein